MKPLSSEQAKRFMSLPLPERWKIYACREMWSADRYDEEMKKRNYNYLALLLMLKQRLPGEFFAYFNDLLCEEEYDWYYKQFNKSIGF